MIVYLHLWPQGNAAGTVLTLDMTTCGAWLTHVVCWRSFQHRGAALAKDLSRQWTFSIDLKRASLSGLLGIQIYKQLELDHLSCVCDMKDEKIIIL